MLIGSWRLCSPKMNIFLTTCEVTNVEGEGLLRNVEELAVSF